ncbi:MULTISPECIES: hypothetical protein [Clostridiaceae]|uniref:hypothetical protein n=1 Tax=Clostridiaceae TaxID=31979 RepID=UPI000558ADF2|nr:MULTISPECIES: hypothetical protein [Clostridiaceae]
MKSEIKYKSLVILIIVIPILFVSYILYGIFGPQKISETITGSVVLIEKDNKEEHEVMKKRKSPYSYKEKDGENYYIIINSIESNSYKKCLVSCTKEQFQKLRVGENYYYHVKYARGDETKGNLQEATTYNPVQ